MMPGLPPSDDDESVLRQARDWQAAGDRVVLALVSAAWGSAPRGVGSYMAVREDGLFCGSVSGGCVEAAVVAAAEAMADEETFRAMSFGITDEVAQSRALPCGGALGITLARPPAGLLADLVARVAARRPAVLSLAPDAVRLLDGAAAEEAVTLCPAGGGLTAPDGAFLRVHVPALHLVIVGAVHLAQALAALAQRLGFRVTVVDHRRGFADPARFPAVELVVRQTEAAFDDIPLDSSTAIAVLAHQPGLDDPALLRGLDSAVFYVGALGSRRTHAQRVRRLAGLGVPEAALARIHAPIGLDIGAESPAEIALAILAEIVAARRGRDPRALASESPR